MADFQDVNPSRIPVAVYTLWRQELQRFVDDTGLVVTVCHYPPGTSKWNKIEHRMYSHITQNWRGRPWETVETIFSLIAATTTTAGLRVRAALDKKLYPGGLRVSDEEMELLNVIPRELVERGTTELNPPSSFRSFPRRR